MIVCRACRTQNTLLSSVAFIHARSTWSIFVQFSRLSFWVGIVPPVIIIIYNTFWCVYSTICKLRGQKMPENPWCMMQSNNKCNTNKQKDTRRSHIKTGIDKKNDDVSNKRKREICKQVVQSKSEINWRRYSTDETIQFQSITHETIMRTICVASLRWITTRIKPKNYKRPTMTMMCRVRKKTCSCLILKRSCVQQCVRPFLAILTHQIQRNAAK